MDNLQKVCIWFSVCELSSVLLHKVLKVYSNNIETLLKLEKYEGRITSLLSGAEFLKLMETRSTRLVETLKELNKGKVKFVCLNDAKYPKKLKTMENSPFVLYYCGDIDLLNSPKVAIIGSRACSNYGREQTERFTKSLINEGLILASGLSEGIETYACETALKYKAKVVVFLANGLNSVYPALNTQLARQIVKNGGVIVSEMCPSFKPRAFSFIERNRLLAYMSDLILLIEAGEKSGALHTVNFGVDFGKEIFVIPANCNTLSGIGSNNLLKQYFTVCVTSPEEIVEKTKADLNLNALNTPKVEEVKKIDLFEQKMNLNDVEKKLVEALEIEETHIDELMKKVNMDLPKLLVLLTTLEIRGIVKKFPGNYYGL